MWMITPSAAAAAMMAAIASGEISAESHEHPLGEVKDIGGFEHHRKTQGHQSIDAAKRDATEENLYEHGEVTLGLKAYFMYFS